MNVKHIALLAATCVVAASAALIPSAAGGAQASLPATLVCEPMSSAYDVNDAGVVAGYVGSWPNVRAVTCVDGNLSYLTLPSDASGSIAVAINSAGQVAGQLNLASGAQEGVVWNPDGSMTRLGFLPGSSMSAAQDINDHGWVVGVASASVSFRAFLWRGSGPIETLPMPTGMTTSYAYAINNDGVVVGSASAGYPAPPPYPPSLAVVWEDGVVTALPPLAEGAAASTADINDAGQIVGNSATTAAPWLVRHAVLWDNGNPIDLGSLGGDFGLAAAINGEGDIAGYMVDPATNENHAFAWSNGTLTLLDPLPDDHLSVALGMNGRGDIVGITAPTNGPVGRAVSWTLAGDTTPPELSVSATPNTLWPPSHKYVTVNAAVEATDDSGENPTVELVSVTSSEPDNGENDGNTVNDIVVLDQDTLLLRAERNEYGRGRIYTITYQASDSSGNATTESATVTVPVSRP
jgi:probable HAF family extracellular repeat protein